jgi:outer membrane receptor for ferric coprogen and ferric-rhodotorulic acid
MKKICTVLMLLVASAGYMSAQNTEKTETYDKDLELQAVEIVAYRLKNISYTDSIIDVGPWSNLRLLDVPYSISTLTSDMMKNLQVNSLNEVSKYMPSMQIEARGGLEVGRPQTRGFQG